jgi:Lsr2 protein
MRTLSVVMAVFLLSMRSSDNSDSEAQWNPAEVRAWARERGLGVGERGRIPEPVIELYMAQPSTVRKWASSQGIEVSERGRLPAEVMERYLSRPAAVRAWARRQGIEIGDRGRIPEELVTRFLERFRQLEGNAA